MFARTLLVMDRGFYAFPFFDWLTTHGHGFIIQARSLSAYEVTTTLTRTPRLRDTVIRLGRYRSNPCTHPVRLIEVQIGATWRGYLTNVLDPTILSPADVVDLYGRRWRIEEAFGIVKAECQAVRGGVAEWATCYVQNEGRGVPLSRVFEQPFIAPTNPLAGVRIAQELAPRYFVPEFQKQGVVWGSAIIALPADLMSKKPVRRWEDLAGMKIIAQGFPPELAKAMRWMH